MKRSRIGAFEHCDLEVIVKELEGLWYLSSYSFSEEALHKFVRGLIFAEKILQIIESKLNVYYSNWGQIFDERTGNYLSKECDIIIYKKKQRIFGKKAINFALVNSADVKLVIQCCTNITSLSKEHKDYPKNLKRFVPRIEIWYFAECYWGSKKQCNVIKKKLKKVGYDRFFYLYRKYERQGEMRKELNYDGWDEFIESISSLR